MMVRALRTLSPTAVLVAALLFLAPAAFAKDHKVAIKDVKFTPKELKVKKGDTVTWTNADERDHTVTAADASFNSGNIRDGGTFRQKFEKPGTYKYHCEYHPRMKATIVVGE